MAMTRLEKVKEFVLDCEKSAKRMEIEAIKDERRATAFLQNAQSSAFEKVKEYVNAMIEEEKEEALA